MKGEQEGLDLIESMNHVMKEGLKMIFLPLKAFKMFPGWSTTKKHYDRIMEINYRRVTGAMEKLDLNNESDNSHGHLGCWFRHHRKHLRLFALSPCGEPRQTE